MKHLSNAMCLLVLAAARLWAGDAAPSATELDPAQAAEAAKRFPANEWVEIATKVVIPEKWKAGRFIYINSYASIVYCASIGAAMTMDGYTYTPAGKSCANNYSDSVYTFDPMKAEYELFKRSNWWAGGRTNALELTSHPLDENKSDPTPCPRHLYHGITWLPETDSFYLINGANAGVPNEHPKYKENNGTPTRTFWSMDVPTRTWKMLEYPPLKRSDPYGTVLAAVPGTGMLYYFDAWSVAGYDTKSAKWSVLQGDIGRPVGINSYYYDGPKFVDSKRRRVVFYACAPWSSTKGEPPLTKSQLYAFDVAKKDFETINGSGAADFEKFKSGAYLANIDKYFYLTDKGQYLFDPASNQWKKLKLSLPENLRKNLTWCYLTFDTRRGLVIMNNHTTWAVLRIDEKSLQFE